MAWMHRLQAHPLVAAALAGEVISVSWAREICAWTDRLPPELAGDADRILLAAAAAGADLRDLALLAAEMLARAAPPDGDGDGFADRSLWLDKTLAGAGRLAGDLTPACTAALSAVLDALGGKTGPEDTRTATQRRHDALEEACQRLIGAGMVPGRDGQPLHIYAHMDLARLATATAAAAAGSRAESRWSLARTVAGPGAWCPTGPDADAAACDATVIPIITGHVDWSLADHLISLAVLPWAAAHTSAAPPGDPADPPGPMPARNPAPSARGRPAPPGSSATHDPPPSPPSRSPAGPEHCRGSASPVTPASPAGPAPSGHPPAPPTRRPDSRGPRPVAAAGDPARHRAAVRPHRPGRPAPRPHPGPPVHRPQPAPGRRHPHPDRAAAPATGRDPAGPALPVPRLHPAPRGLPDPPPEPREPAAAPPPWPTWPCCAGSTT